MPSSAASAAMLRWFLAKLNASSPMLIWKCLAMWRRPSTAPTAWPIAAAPRSGLRARCTPGLKARGGAPPLHAGLDAREVVLGDGQQLFAFAGPLRSQQRVLADHQAFAGIVGAGDLRHVAVIEQRGLQRPARGRELLDRESPQRGYPIQTGRA